MSNPEGAPWTEAAGSRNPIDEIPVCQMHGQRTIADLINRARELIDNAQYGEAKGVVNQILILDPRNQYAIGIFSLLGDRTVSFERRFDPESLLASTPDWLLISLAAALLFVLSRFRARARSRTDDGLCLACGYDLRATPHRCPECGLVPIEGS